ncbi:NADPH2:quinone reductase [Pedobacter sp. UYP30]|uniref:quinone oxidoreductase family protein n=1 Tax=Pedobacter sp. UYP30 TaxID=1756400 RepID=UPI0033925B62
MKDILTTPKALRFTKILLEKMKAIILKTPGGVEKMLLEEMPELQATPGHVVVDVAIAGVNFMDIGTREGQFMIAPFPMTPGVEGAGTVAYVGAGVTEFKKGDRVAWFFIVGSYAEQILAPAGLLVPLPDDINFETGASLMMQGLTAQHFTSSTYAIKPGDTALVHAAAGGVGLMITQMVKLLGGRVIARVSSEDKVVIAKNAGADEVIVTQNPDYAEKVLSMTDGEGVHVVYDNSGADTFWESIASLRTHGVMAYYGASMKKLAPIDILSIPKSILLTYPTIQDHVRSRKDILQHSLQLFDWFRNGKLKVFIGKTYPLSDAALAHLDIESRRTTGKLLLMTGADKPVKPE